MNRSLPSELLGPLEIKLTVPLNVTHVHLEFGSIVDVRLLGEEGMMDLKILLNNSLPSPSSDNFLYSRI